MEEDLGPLALGLLLRLLPWVETDYLGFLVISEGIEICDDYVTKILQWPTPVSPKELSSFLAFTGYYQIFILEYSKLTGEMNSQKLKKSLDWMK